MGNQQKAFTAGISFKSSEMGTASAGLSGLDLDLAQLQAGLKLTLQ
jgi:hypothetical protein